MIYSVCVINGNYGNMDLSFADESKLSITLNEAEAREIQIVAERIYERRQASISREVAKPLAALADFTEVPPKDESDDMPF